MPKKCIKFVSEYLIPNLNNKRFGDRLKWLDENKQIFQIDWPHKAGPQWTEKGAEVFVVSLTIMYVLSFFILSFSL